MIDTLLYPLSDQATRAIGGTVAAAVEGAIQDEIHRHLTEAIADEENVHGLGFWLAVRDGGRVVLHLHLDGECVASGNGYTSSERFPDIERDVDLGALVREDIETAREETAKSADEAAHYRPQLAALRNGLLELAGVIAEYLGDEP